MGKDERSSRKDRDFDRDRRRRHRSPSYDSSDYSSDDSYVAPRRGVAVTAVREVSPPRRSRKSRGAYSDGEETTRGRDRGRTTRDRYVVAVEASPSPTRRNVVEDLLAAVGLVNAKNTKPRKSDRSDRKSSRSERGGGDDDDDEARETKKAAKKQALQAALTAAAVEAFKSRKEPGGLTAERLMRIAGAAIAAGGVDVLIDRNPNNNGTRHIIESVVAGLATSKTMGDQVKHKRPQGISDKVGGGMIGMATRQLLSRSMSRGANSKRK